MCGYNDYRFLYTYHFNVHSSGLFNLIIGLLLFIPPSHSYRLSLQRMSGVV